MCRQAGNGSIAGEGGAGEGASIASRPAEPTGEAGPAEDGVLATLRRCCTGTGTGKKRQASDAHVALVQVAAAAGRKMGVSGLVRTFSTLPAQAGQAARSLCSDSKTTIVFVLARVGSRQNTARMQQNGDILRRPNATATLIDSARQHAYNV